MKKQLLFVHGGDAYDDRSAVIKELSTWEVSNPFEPKEEKRWKYEMVEQLGDGWACAFPSMPNKEDARFEEWEMWFEKFVPFLEDGVVLVGNSLGGNFFAKYLALKKLPVRVSQLHLVAACFGWKGNFELPEDLSKAVEQCDKIHIHQSQDDPIVTVEHAHKYHEALKNSELHLYDGRGHFLVETFPEIVENIKSA